MKERPILFSGPMVRAILEGRKTQTRRVLKYEDFHGCLTGDCIHFKQATCDSCLAEYARTECPYGVPGDRLWVKETWTGCYPCFEIGCHLQYAADGSENWMHPPEGYRFPKAAAKVGNWVTPLFMPRWASRITLEITDIRVQRLQKISEEDAIAEGVEWHHGMKAWRSYNLISQTPFLNKTAVGSFRTLWDSINAARGHGWNENPWTWAITFGRVS